MIAQYYALGVQCSACAKQSSPINVDRTKYMAVGQDAYTKMVCNRAEERAIQEGFIRLGKKSVPGSVHDRHLCGDCLVDISKHIDKASSPAKSKSSSK